MKLFIQIMSVIVLWLLAVAWAYIFYGNEMTFENIESAVLAFLVGFVMCNLVDKYYEKE